MTTLVVDGDNITMRAIKASLGSQVHLSAQMDGEEVNTGPLLIFINSLTKYVRQVHPDRMVVCWDPPAGHGTYRSDLWPGYKSARAERSDTEVTVRHDTYGLAHDFLDLSRISSDAVRHEGDDLVAAYVQGTDDEVFILSGDKDFLQLVGPRVKQIRPGQPQEVWDEEQVYTAMGAPPPAIPFIMALTGDTIDGIPGVPRFGTKTAVKFLERNGWDFDRTLEEERIREHADRARLNFDLVNLTAFNGRLPCGLEILEAPAFTPVEPDSDHGQTLTGWLNELDMSTVANKFALNRLWRDRPAFTERKPA